MVAVLLSADTLSAADTLLFSGAQVYCEVNVKDSNPTRQMTFFLPARTQKLKEIPLLHGDVSIRGRLGRAPFLSRCAPFRMTACAPPPPRPLLSFPHRQVLHLFGTWTPGVGPDKAAGLRLNEEEAPLFLRSAFVSERKVRAGNPSAHMPTRQHAFSPCS